MYFYDIHAILNVNIHWHWYWEGPLQRVVSKATRWACLKQNPSGCRAGDSLGSYPGIHRQVLRIMWLFRWKSTVKRSGGGNRGSEWEEGKNWGGKMQRQGADKMMKLEPSKNKRSMTQTFCFCTISTLLATIFSCYMFTHKHLYRVFHSTHAD